MLVPSPDWAAIATIEGNVIVHKIGKTYLFVFPSPRGRLITAPTNPAGEISIGDNVTIAYALKIINGGRARFVGVDGSDVPESVINSLKIALKVKPSHQTFGFMIKDTRQPHVDISISPAFMAEKRNKAQLQEQIARTGNLSMVLAPAGNGVKILKVFLD